MSLWDHIAHAASLLGALVAAWQLGRWLRPLARKGWRSMQQHAKPKQSEFLTTPEVAAIIGIRPAQARWVCEKGFFLDYIWVGRQRAIRRGDVEKFRQAARDAGYLRD